MIYRFLIYIFLFFLIPISSYCQSKADLSQQIDNTKKEIELTNKLLNKTANDKLLTYNNLVLLNKKIKLREKYIAGLNKEIKLIQNNLDNTKLTIVDLQSQVKELKAEYSKLIYYAYINKSSYERMIFVLSSSDFNQAYKRIRYFQYISTYRKNQVAEIIQTQDSLKVLMNVYDSTIVVKQNMINEAKNESNKLSTEKSEQKQIVKSLESEEKRLKRELKEKQELADKLQKEIEKLIAEEQRKKAEQNKFKRTPEDKLISTQFSDNKGRLPWPTVEGVVTEQFGEHPHPVLKNIKVMNNGIDISTSPNTMVRSIFDGTVSKIIAIPGSNAAILIRHGDYLTVYNNLVNVKVKPGQTVKAKQIIGTVFTEPDTKKTTMQLQIWKETEKLNPEIWLSKSK